MLLTTPRFLILTAINVGSGFGWEIAEYVSRQSGGRARVGSVLYKNLRLLVQEGLLEQCEDGAYLLTDRGAAALASHKEILGAFLEPDMQS